MKRHPKQRPEDEFPAADLKQPYQSENAMAEAEANVLAQQRKSSGGLTDDPSEAPAKNDRPFKKLSSGR